MKAPITGKNILNANLHWAALLLASEDTVAFTIMLPVVNSVEVAMFYPYNPMLA